MCTIRGPSEETEDKYLAEIPALPGCRAWGDTEAEALDYARSVAVAFLESYEENGDNLPSTLRDLRIDRRNFFGQ